jgi:putative ABC transport system permease protein
METLGQDLRYAFRLLIASRGLTAVAVLSLAVGIGANTTIFTFVDALLLKPPAVADPAGLREIWQHNAARGSGIGSHMQLSYPDYEFYRDHNRVFSEMGAVTGETSDVIWNRGGEGETLRGSLVSGNFFSVLGLRPALGRAFLAQEDQPATAAPVIVLSHAAWKQRLGADPGILGQTLTLNGRAFTVVGVAPPGFSGLLAGFAPDFWTPLSMRAATNPGLDVTERHQHWILGIGRMRPGVTPAQVNADLGVLGQQLATDFPGADRNLLPAALPVELVPSPFRGVAGGISGVLMAVVGLVLLIACANVANLLLAKAASRRREIAVRSALGASRRRLVRQMLTESAVIAIVAGALGLLLSLWATPLLLSLKPASVPILLDVSTDVRVLTFTLAASMLTGLAFGLVPALQQSRFGEAADLKDGGHGAGAARSRLRNALVIAQVAACVFLLAGASLCMRSLSNASSIDPGFDTRHAVAASLNLEPFGYDAARGQAFYGSLLDRVRALPGVRAAAYADHLPLGQMTRMEGVAPDGYDAPAGPNGPVLPAIDVALVSPGYFDAIGTPIVAGRGFTNGDNAGAPPVIVINERMAERFWPHQDAVGRFVTLSGPNKTRVRAEVVGVAKTGRYSSLGEDPKPYFYRSLLQSYEPGVGLIVRTEGDAPILDAVRHEVRGLDSRLALTGAETLEQHMQLPLFPARAAGLLLGLFGFLALALAIVGLYGVMSFAVSQRFREIGVRMALGARPRDVLGLVVWHGLRLTLIGLVLGLALAAAGTRVLSNVLYGITPTDPLSYGAVIVVLALAALLASYVPARWATRVDPIRALRTQ